MMENGAIRYPKGVCMAIKVIPKELFGLLKEVKNISKDKGLQVKIRVMDGKEFIRWNLGEDEGLKKQMPSLVDWLTKEK
jgi:hypothetical protein